MVSPKDYAKYIEEYGTKRQQEIKNTAGPYQGSGSYQPANLPAPVEMGESQNGTDYWLDPINVAAAYNYVRSGVPGSEPPAWLDWDGVQQAYKMYEEVNGGKPWYTWEALPEGHPGREFLETLAAPPEYGVAEPTPAPQEPTIAQSGLTDEQYAQLSPIQKVMLGAFGSGLVAGAAQGGIAGGLTGGVPGMIGGTVLGGGLGGFAEKTQGTWAGNALMWLGSVLDIGAEGVERVLGTGKLLTMDARQNGALDVLENLDDAWKAAHLAYEVAPIGKDLDWASPVPLQGKSGEAALQDIYTRIRSGESMESLQKEYGSSMSAVLREAVGHIVLDPLNIIGGVLAKGVGWLSKGNEALSLAMKTSGGLIEGIQKYRTFLRTGEVAGKTVEELSHMGAVTRWLAGVTKAEGATAFEKFLWGIEEGGKSIALEKIKPQTWHRVTSGLIGSTGGAFLGFGLGGPIGAVALGGIGGLAGWTRYLTPAARASELANVNILGIHSLLDQAGNDPALSYKWIKSLMKSDVAPAAEISKMLYDSPEGVALPLILRDAEPKIDAKWAEFEADGWSRQMVENMAAVVKRDPYEMLNDIKDGNADTLLRQYIDAARQSGDDAAKDIVKAFDAKELTGETLKGMVKTFVEDKHPLSSEAWHADVMSLLTEHTAQWSAKWFDVKPDPTLIRLAHTIKGAQSIALLGLNPTYFINNSLNNIVTTAATGVFGLKPQQMIDDFWLKRIGYVPPRLRQGVGAVGDVENVFRPIQNAQVQEGTLTNINRVTGKISEKAGVFTNLGAKNERWTSAQAMTSAMQQFIGRFWRRGKGFEKMHPTLEAMLKQVDPNLPNAVYAAIEGGLNRVEIEAKLWDGLTRRTVDEFIGDYVEHGGSDAAQWAETVKQSGVYDILKEKLQEAETPEQRRKAFDDTHQQMQDQFDAWLREDIENEAEAAAARVGIEGVQGVYEIVDRMAYEIAERDMLHWGRTNEAAQEAARMGGGGIIWRNVLNSENVAYRRMYKRHEAWMAGVAKGLGVESPVSRAVLDQMFAGNDVWRTFWNKRLRMMDEIDSGRISFEDGMAEIDRLYKQAQLDEAPIMDAMDAALVEMFVKKWGEDVRQSAVAWRDGVKKVRVKMREAMIKQRSEGGQSWNDFLKGGYLQQIIDLMKANQEGAAKVYRVRTGKEAPAPTPAPEQPALANIDWQQGGSQVNRPPMPEPEVTPAAVPPAPAGKTLADIDRAWLEAEGWKGGKRHLLNAVNKDFGTKYKTFREVPEEEALAVLGKRLGWEEYQPKAEPKPDVEAAAIPEPEKVAQAQPIPEPKELEAEIAKVPEDEIAARRAALGRFLTLDEMRAEGKGMFFTADEVKAMPSNFKDYEQSAAYKIRQYLQSEEYKSLPLAEQASILSEMQKYYTDLLNSKPAYTMTKDEFYGLYKAYKGGVHIGIGLIMPRDEFPDLHAAWDEFGGSWMQRRDGSFVFISNKKLGQHPVRMEEGLELHRATVQKALADGKEVPPEVLAEYPDLAPKPVREPVYISPEMRDLLNDTMEALAQRERVQARLADAAAVIANPDLLPPGDIRDSLRRGFVDIMRLPEDEADGTLQLMDAWAQHWAAETGRPAGEWWQTHFAGMVEGGAGEFEQAVVKTDTPEFRRWFGASKVVDEQGQPLVVYHGTINNFDVFNTNTSREVAFGKGAYFTPFTEYANDYSAVLGENLDTGLDWTGGNVKPVYLSIKNPFDWREEYGHGMPGASEEITRDLRRRGYDGVFVYNYDKVIAPGGLTDLQFEKISEWYAKNKPGLSITREMANRTFTKGLDYKNFVTSYGEELASYFTVTKKLREIVAFNPEQIKSIFNAGTFDPANPNILQQGPKGAVGFLQDGRAVIHSLTAPDVSTAIHEVAHVFRRDLTGADLAVVEEWAGVTGGVWERAHEERFARGFEKYMADGQAPTPALKRVFEQFKRWMLRVYTTLTGSAIDVDVTPEVRAVFDKWLGKEIEREAPKAELARIPGVEIESAPVRQLSQDVPDYPVIREWLDGTLIERYRRYAKNITEADRKLSPARAESLAAEIIAKEYGVEAERLGNYRTNTSNDPIGQLHDEWIGRMDEGSNPRSDLVDWSGTRWAETDADLEKYAPIARGEAIPEAAAYIPTQAELNRVTHSSLVRLGDVVTLNGKEYAVTKTRDVSIDAKPIKPDGTLGKTKWIDLNGQEVLKTDRNIYQPTPAPAPEPARPVEAAAVSEAVAPAAPELAPVGSPVEFGKPATYDGRKRIIASRKIGNKSVEVRIEQTYKDKNEYKVYTHYYKGTGPSGARVGEDEIAWGLSLKEAKAKASAYLKTVSDVEPGGKPIIHEAKPPQRVVQDFPPELLAKIAKERPGKWGYTKTQVDYIKEQLTTYIDRVEVSTSRLGPLEIPIPGDGLIRVSDSVTAKNLLDALEKSPTRASQGAAPRKVSVQETVNVAIRLYGSPQAALEKLQAQMTGDLEGVDTSTYSRAVMALQDLITKSPEEQEQAIEQAMKYEVPVYSTEVGFNYGKLIGYRQQKTLFQDWTPTATGPKRILDSAEDGILYQDADGSVSHARMNGSDPDPAKMPLGTSDKFQTTPPLHRMSEDAWNNYIWPVLLKMRDGMSGREGTRATSVKGAAMTPEVERALRAYLEGTVYPQLGDTKRAGIRWAENRRDAALLNYTRRYEFDNVFGAIFPYQFWYTRSAIQWALRSIDHPGWLANYARLRRMQENVTQQPGFPKRLEKKMRMPVPFMPAWAGGSVYFDPLHQVFPFEQMVKPFQQLADDQNQITKRAGYILDEWAADETITQDQYAAALSDPNDPNYQKAMAQAKNEIDEEISNPFDFINAMSGPLLPLGWAYNALTGRKEKIGMLPVTRQIRGITSWMTPGGVNLEAGVRKAAGLPAGDQFDDYYVDRMLANLAAEGVLTPEAAQQAMIERQGEAFNLALDRVGKMQFFRNLGSFLWLDFFPEGEQQHRELKASFTQAVEQDKLGEWYDAHPDYAARQMSYKWDDPEGRLKKFLISEVWNRYNNLPDLHQKEAREQLGDLFADTFINKETRSYDSLDVSTLASWAQALNGYVPKGTTYTPQNLNLSDKKLTATYQNYVNLRERLFGEDIFDVQSEYYALPEGKQRRVFLQRFPKLKQYWDWKAAMNQNYPELKPYFDTETKKKMGTYQPVESEPIVDVSTWPPQLLSSVVGHIYAGESLGEGAQKMLEDIWMQAGEPYGDYDLWLEAVMQAFK